MKLIEKIAKIQQEVSIHKDGKNPFFKSKYITLDEIVGKLNPLLVENKVVVIHKNINNGVETTVYDLDTDEKQYSIFLIEGVTDPQKMGAIISYGRRYNLVSLFNIIADEDDDCNKFYEKKKEKKPEPNVDVEQELETFDIDRFMKFKKRAEKKTKEEVKQQVLNIFQNMVVLEDAKTNLDLFVKGLK